LIVTTATTRPGALGAPFTHWSLRKLAAHLAGNAERRVRVGRERLRQILREAVRLDPLRWRGGGVAGLADPRVGCCPG
jgi:hypothetical protein